MAVSEITTGDVAIWLAIYASVVSTAAGLWALFHGVFRDRARITVKADEAFFLQFGDGTQMVVKTEDTLDEMSGVVPPRRREILRIVVRNRGRRDATILSVGQATWTGAQMFGDLSDQVPFELPAETSKTLVIGARRNYRHGDHSTRRFYVEDGVERKHPLRARWRLRLETVLYRWVIHLYWWWWRRKRRRARVGERGD